MAWYEEAVFYHIYPLGLTGAPKQNAYEAPVHRLRLLLPWIEHIRSLGCTALYIGPLFESVGHGYETTDYKKLDSRLGTNEDLKEFVAACHHQGLRVIFDGVFNHTGRDFFAFRDLLANRENSPYRDWYCNVNFWGNNEYNDGFSYENWGGYNLLVKLNQRNPAVRDYICEVIRFWVSEFDIDGIRLDAADVLDFDFMKALRWTANTVKPDFWLMGEVIHGDYSRWANSDTLHSVTNYMMHKALFSGHNDHNYFEIAHTIRHIDGMTGGRQYCRSLYTFADNHDVERIATKLWNKAHFTPVHVLLYTLPGIPSLYYGSEFGIDGPKHRGGSDDAIRPSIRLSDFIGKEAWEAIQSRTQEEIPNTARATEGLDPGACAALIRRLGQVRKQVTALAWGAYDQRCLTNRQYAFARCVEGGEVLVAVNNDEGCADLFVPARDGAYREALSGERKTAQGGGLAVTLQSCSGQIWVPEEWLDTDSEVPQQEPRQVTTEEKVKEPEETKEPERESEKEPEEAKETERESEKEPEEESKKEPEKKPEVRPETETVEIPDRPLEEMTVPELQAVILQKLSANGPVTDRMRAEVKENIWRDSLLNWAKSFR